MHDACISLCEPKVPRSDKSNMLHHYYKWRYERKARSGAFELPESKRPGRSENANLGNFLSQTSGVRGSLKPFDLPRKRRRFMRILAVALILALLAWITYESIIALALIGK